MRYTNIRKDTHRDNTFAFIGKVESNPIIKNVYIDDEIIGEYAVFNVLTTPRWSYYCSSGLHRTAHWYHVLAIGDMVVTVLRKIEAGKTICLRGQKPDKKFVYETGDGKSKLMYEFFLDENGSVFVLDTKKKRAKAA